MKRLFATPWYPVALSAYSVLAIFSHNVAEVRANMLWRPLLAAILGTSVLHVGLRRALKSWERAAIVTALLVALFFSYGHLLDFLISRKVDYAGPIMAALWACLAALGLGWGLHTSSTLTRATLPLNAAGAALLLIPLVGMVSFSVGMASAGTSLPSAAYTPELDVPSDARPPDIYYIILDSYARADVLERAYDYDNRGFLQNLEEMGFYVASCSQSNYTRTELSLGSSLNMDYIQNLDPVHFVPENLGRSHLWELLRHGSVRAALEGIGYRTVAFATGFPWSEVSDADVFLEPWPLWNQLTEFETLWVSTTAARALDPFGVLRLEEAAAARFRERTRFALDSFDELARMPGPKFVMMHIIAPHPPFVFGPNGEAIDPGHFLDQRGFYSRSSYAEGYVDEVTFLNREMQRAAALLIAESPSPPVIVIQGDHGPWLQPPEMHFRILNAYYLPGHADALYPSISPVNTFRVILDSYLGAELGLLEDVTYNSPVPNIYRFTPISNSCGEDPQAESD